MPATRSRRKRPAKTSGFLRHGSQADKGRKRGGCACQIPGASSKITRLQVHSLSQVRQLQILCDRKRQECGHKRPLHGRIRLADSAPGSPCGSLRIKMVKPYRMFGRLGREHPLKDHGLKLFSFQRCVAGFGNQIHLGHKRIRLLKRIILAKRNKIDVFRN